MNRAAPTHSSSLITHYWMEWAPIAAGLLVMYVPTFYHAATSYWQYDENAHGPIILAIVIWLIWRSRSELLTGGTSLITHHPLPITDYRSPITHHSPVTGFTVLALGLLCYVLGRSVDIAFFEVGSLAPVLAGVLLIMRGWPALRALWFPIFFIAFMVPLPGMFVDALTGPLKQEVSRISELIVHAAGYPVGRDGVMITIGNYQLLVADACSGLHTIFSLSALGLLFMYMTARTSLLHNAIMLASIIPIAFVANIIRVLILMLITYHFGDEAGQGFLHGAASIVLLLVALIALFILDAILNRLFKPRKQAEKG